MVIKWEDTKKEKDFWNQKKRLVILIFRCLMFE